MHTPPRSVLPSAPSMYRKISAENIGVVWKRFVFDEPAHVRVPGMHLPMAGFTWFVTATPKEIKSNQLSFIYPFFFQIYQR
jgi:hypothetical protein